MPIQRVSEWTNFFCSIDSENAKKCLQSNSAFAILTLRDGDGVETSPLVKSSQMPEPGSKPPGGREQMNRSGTPELTPSVTR